MGNCWRIPEDYSSLVDLPTSPFISIAPSSTDSLSNSNSSFIHPISTICDICLVDFIASEHVRQLPCDGAHVFHPPCIDTWLKKSLTCPHCSINVDAALLLKFIPKSNKNDDED
ncbi:unnamed protein product [Rotaria magnacalcarata]|uniref:RING-type domain-containing protein n=1 Tax=Rotaria magnacalcarata TaxID=392030 RepID=A0A8S2MY10_9BILA|nr:unnamed protein product [Rotaria magnacalcarata]